MTRREFRKVKQEVGRVLNRPMLRFVRNGRVYVKPATNLQGAKE